MQAFGKIDSQAFAITREDGSPFKGVPAGSFVLVNEAQVDGFTVLSLLSGESLSIRPNGNVEVRVAGTTGPWERGIVDGGVISYTPDVSVGVAWVFGLKAAQNA